MLPIPLLAQGKLGERRAREIKTRSAEKSRTITIRLPTTIIEAIDELMNVGFYTNRTEVIRSILSQELPRRLARYQATCRAPVEDDDNKRKNVSVYMTKRMYDNLLTMAEVLEVSKSELIRTAIDHFFREYGEVYLRKLEVDGA